LRASREISRTAAQLTNSPHQGERSNSGALLLDQCSDSRRHRFDRKWLRHHRHSRLQVTLAEYGVLRVTRDEKDFQIRTAHTGRIDADTGEEVSNEDIVKGYALDADCWQEAGEGNGGEEARSEAASEVRLIPEEESRMDMKDASAMTEASGLTNEQSGNERWSAARHGPIQPPSQDAAIRWAERLRKVTVKAPLQSLFVAFLLGIWLARRR
jgi:hypothetical protein